MIRVKTDIPIKQTSNITGWGSVVRTAGVFDYIAASVVIIAACTQNLLATEIELADVVIVKKAERRIYLVTDQQVLKSFSISLGLMPDGEKIQEGDFKTPEGRYQLTERNGGSDFFRSIQITYPNRRDEERAARLGVSPGGRIMIHGQPNKPRYSKAYYRNYDWTDGCIALSNTDMMDFWQMTSANTPIHIFP